MIPQRNIFDNPTLVCFENAGLRLYLMLNKIKEFFLFSGVCEDGCVEVEAIRLYEEQFTYESKLIHIKQVHSVEDVPSSGNEQSVDIEDVSFAIL